MIVSNISEDICIELIAGGHYIEGEVLKISNCYEPFCAEQLLQAQT